MKDSVIIVPAGCKCKEVLACFGTQLAKELDFYVTVSGLESEGHSIINI